MSRRQLTNAEAFGVCIKQAFDHMQELVTVHGNTPFEAFDRTIYDYLWPLQRYGLSRPADELATDAHDDPVIEGAVV